MTPFSVAEDVLDEEREEILSRFQACGHNRCPQSAGLLYAPLTTKDTLSTYPSLLASRVMPLKSK